MEAPADSSDAPHGHSWKLLSKLLRVVQTLLPQQTSVNHRDRGASRPSAWQHQLLHLCSSGAAYALKREDLQLPGSNAILACQELSPHSPAEHNTGS